MKKIPRQALRQHIASLEEELDEDVHAAKHDYLLVKQHVHSSTLIKILLGVAAVGVVLMARPAKKEIAAPKKKGSIKSKIVKTGKVVEALGMIATLRKMTSK